MMLAIRSVLVLVVFAIASHAATLSPTNLRCEYRINPLGIGSQNPRLSWVLKSDKPQERGQKQSAYQIVVASSPEKLDAGKGDLWDTAQVQSDATAQIEYAGQALASGQQVWWKVRVWNGDNKASAWSEPATWSMALLDPSKWQAKWIGYDAPADANQDEAEEKAITLDGLKWIWSDEGETTKNPAKSAPPGVRFFAKALSLPADAKVRKALFLCSADDHLDLIVNGKGAGEAASFQSAQMLDVSTLLQSGENVLAIKARNATGPAGVVGRLMVWVVGADQPLIVNVDSSWKWSRKSPDDWAKAAFDKWPAAKESVEVGADPWKTPAKTDLTLPPPPYLRKAFSTDKQVKRAIVRASALG
jgi:alpha-L-rhamnosidase